MCWTMPASSQQAPPPLPPPQRQPTSNTYTGPTTGRRRHKFSAMFQRGLGSIEPRSAMACRTATFSARRLRRIRRRTALAKALYTRCRRSQSLLAGPR
jgi:hypothetical protein